MLTIAIGDPTGIGPEVTLKALAAELPYDNTPYLIIGDTGILQRLNESLELGLSFDQGRIQIHRPLTPMPAGLQIGSALAAKASIEWAREGARLCLSGEATGLVTGPVNKAAIIGAGETGFVGQTEMLSQMAGTNRTAMMLLGTDDRDRWLRVALATIHVPLRDVASRLTQEGIELVIELTAQACQDLGLPSARVAVCGLNPHAGEGGNMGDEEITIIAPAVEAARERGLDVHGPYAADALFHFVFQGHYDAVVAMYHDQGLVPLKMIAFEQGVNWTLGLPFIRTSPDHGTAYDIVGQGVADPSSMIAAIRLAKQLVLTRR